MRVIEELKQHRQLNEKPAKQQKLINNATHDLEVSRGNDNSIKIIKPRESTDVNYEIKIDEYNQRFVDDWLGDLGMSRVHFG